MAVPYVLITIESGSSQKTYNTFTNWGLIPSGRLDVAPAALQAKYLEIPGKNGELDISDIQTGSPLFKNRTGSWEFNIVPFGYAFTGTDVSKAMLNKTPAQMAQTIYNCIHGKKATVVVSSDPDYAYTGRLQVKSWSSSKTLSKISIDYNLAPTREAVSG